jgi:hypothetical protein
MNEMPNGTPGAFEMMGFAGVATTLSGWKPRGTVGTARISQVSKFPEVIYGARYLL